MKLTLPEEAKIVTALVPATDAAGRTGQYVSLKNAARAYLVLQLAQGNAATIAITIEQSTTVAGAGSKAITNPVRIWANIDVSLNDALIRQPDAVSYTTEAGVKNKEIVIEIDPRSLDQDNKFDCVVVKTGASNVANITSATWILTDLRYAQSPPPSAIVD